MKKISVLIPTWNSENFISTCLESILSQTYSNIEIIVLDAGSRDDTLKIVKQQMKIYDNILLFKKKNASITTLRKKGLDLATGEYVCFVQSEDILNHFCLAELSKSMEKYDADIAMSSFIHSKYKKYYSDRVYNLTDSKDFTCLHRDFLACATLSGKLFRKNLFEHLTIKEIYLREEIMNLVAFLKSKRLVSLKSILCITQEHNALFETKRFWENQESFWFKCKPTITYTKQIYITLKPKTLKLSVPTLIHTRYLDYLIWELLSYAARKASIEQIAMEMYRVLKDSSFQKAKKYFEFEGFKMKDMNDDLLLSTCLLYADTILKQTDYIQGNYPQIDIVEFHYMIFLKLFYKQTGALNTKYYLCQLRENLNLNETLESKLVNQLSLSL